MKKQKNLSHQQTSNQETYMAQRKKIPVANFSTKMYNTIILQYMWKYCIS